MNKFALVFNFPEHDRQVLVRKGADSDDNPSIQLITVLEDGAEMSLGLNFTQEKNDEAEAARDLAFEKEDVLENSARAFAEKLVGVTCGFEAIEALSQG